MDPKILSKPAPHPKTGATKTTESIFATVTEWIALAISTAASVSLLGWVMLRSRHGFDFTDEGFYLNWISNPWNYHESVSNFGFVYYPIYKLVGGDIALLRQVNALIIFALACILCVVLVHSLCQDWIALRASQRTGFVGIAVVLASSSLAFFDLWLPTPSYNSLALQSLIMTAIGMLLADRRLLKNSIAGWTLIGIGGGFAFLAKPTTAAMLGIFVAAYVVASEKFTLRGLLVSLTTATLCLVVSGLAIDGSLSGFLRRFIDGLGVSNALIPNHQLTDVFRWDSFHLSREEKLSFAAVLVLTLTALTPSFLASGWARFGAACIAALLAGTSIITVAGILAPGISHGRYQPMQFGAICLGIGLPALFRPANTFRSMSRKAWALIVFFLVVPYAYAFGTGNNLWWAASRAALFWMLAGFVASAEIAAAGGAWRKLLPVAAVSLLVTTGILYATMEDPYRQILPLQLQASAAKINVENSELFLADATATYIRDLRKLSTENELKPGSPVLDFTGVSPGSLYVIGARPLGSAWTPAGYPGSANFLKTMLDRETCLAIAASWILMEPGSADSFSPDLLRPFGIDIANDYLTVGSIRSTRSFSPQQFEHRLLKPVRGLDVAQLACENTRRNGLAK